MSINIGRNDPCFCGSGKKYKKCCYGKEGDQKQQNFSPRFRFEPGTYGDVGNFVPSIACFKEIRPEEWDYYYVLVNPQKIFDKENEAGAQAEKDLNNSFQHKEQIGSDYAVAEYLKKAGYLNVENFKIIKE